uniref:Uncharacterized protein n=1 Tax=Bracon brevicornis TaxID=1563983 RepID=A0A6V7KQJ4_9HYME
MEKVRREHVPGNPTNLVDFGDMLKSYPPLEHLYKGTLNATDGSTGVIMMHEDMREPLSQCTQLYADGTFKVLFTIFLENSFR